MRSIVFLAALVAGGAAQADCKPLLDAMAKLAQQTRFAAYEVDKPEQALAAEPDIVLIGRTGYTRTGTEWERVDIGFESLSDALSLNDLRKDMAANTVRCMSAGAGTYRGSPVAKYRYETKGDDVPGVVYIDRRTGLPIYQGARDGSGSGMVVMYGDAVKEPRVKR